MFGVVSGSTSTARVGLPLDETQLGIQVSMTVSHWDICSLPLLCTPPPTTSIIEPHLLYIVIPFVFVLESIQI